MKRFKISFPVYAGLTGGVYGLLQAHLMRLALDHLRDPDVLLVYQILLCHALWLLLFAPSLARSLRNRRAKRAI